jgi:hypothetical protein
MSSPLKFAITAMFLGQILLCPLLGMDAIAFAQQPDLASTTSFIKDHLDAHGCSAMPKQTKCNIVTRISVCNLTFQYSVSPGRFIEDPSGTYDLTSLDSAKMVMDNDFMGRTLCVDSATKKLCLYTDSDESSSRLKRALTHAIGLCKSQTPF